MLSKKKLILLIIPFLLFFASLTAQLILRSNTTAKIESVSFLSILDEDPLDPEVQTTSANLFYPKDYDPAEQYPVVIIVHGFEVTKTTDLRLPTELATWTPTPSTCCRGQRTGGSGSPTTPSSPPTPEKWPDYAGYR